MDQDLRQLAILSAEEIEKMALAFPMFSPARKLLKRTAWQINLHYVWGTTQKKKIILLAVGQGNRNIPDITKVTGIERREVCQLLDDLVERGYLVEGRESPIGEKGGRPFRVFTHSEKMKNRPAS